MPTAPARLRGDAVRNGCILLQGGGGVGAREGQVRGGRAGREGGREGRVRREAAGAAAAWKVLEHRKDGGRTQ